MSTIVSPPAESPKLAQFDTHERKPTATRQGPTSDFISTYADYADVLEAPREMHEDVAIVVLANAINGQVWIEYGALTIPLDLWLLVLSPSGFGRSTLVGLTRPLLSAAKMNDAILSSHWGSQQAFYQTVALRPKGLFVWPELSHVLKLLREPRFGGAKEWLTDRYDNTDIPHTINYRTTGKKGDTPPIVFSEPPRISIIATSSFDWFVTNLEQEDSTGGFVPRWVMLWVKAPNRVIPKPRAPNGELLEPLAEHLRRASELKGKADFSCVEQMYDAWYRDTNSRFTAQSNRDLAIPFFNRLRTQVLKLAVVYEVSRSLSVIISPEAMERAIRTARLSEESIFTLLPTGLNREGSEVDKMAERIKAAGPEGITRNELTRAFQHIKRRDREERLSTLRDAGTVVAKQRQTPGRVAQVFVHRQFAEGEHA